MKNLSISFVVYIVRCASDAGSLAIALSAALLFAIHPVAIVAQQYEGMSGLLETPSGEMDTVGQLRIGGHFLNRHNTPDNFKYQGEKYNTGAFYLSATPFKWVQVSYCMVMLKATSKDSGKPYFAKDRHVSVKFQPLAEKQGKWWPAIAIGGDDVLSSDLGLGQKSGYFMNFYVAATKTFRLKQETLGVTLAYRYYTKKINRHWTGVVGGVTYRPSFAKNFRAIVEYAGGGQVNFGIDCVLWKHLMLQASLDRFKYFNGGICYTVNLF